MKRRFSSQELFELRNHIPIDDLITRCLALPSKISGGFFRFLCPLCSGYQTATNPKTNLARCFSCERNFNPIDMVMICRKMNFVESVKYLKTYHEHFILNVKPSTEFSCKTVTGLTRLGKILSQMESKGKNNGRI